jgi:DNA-binding IclR family transcriptional regulator
MAKPQTKTGSNRAPTVYSAPALEKGLDILELLANERAPLSLKKIAEKLGRSKDEIFRMLAVLVSRGYLKKDEQTEDYILTNRLFNLGIRTPPATELLEEALPEMRRFADETGQSVHLGVLSRGESVVVAGVSGYSNTSLTLRIGFGFPTLASTSGRVILAFQPPSTAERLIAESRPLVPENFDFEELKANLEEIREKGFDVTPSRHAMGVIDIACPVLDRGGSAIAVLVVPYLSRIGREEGEKALSVRLLAAAEAISARLP